MREGYRVLVVGEPGHPEVEGILGHAGDDAQVVSCAADANALSLKGKVGLVVQTPRPRRTSPRLWLPSPRACRNYA